VSGGISDVNDALSLQVTETFPVSGGWRVGVYNPHPIEQRFEVRAICLDYIK
jgi:hypothetical protein